MFSVLANSHSAENSAVSAPNICPRKIGSEADTPVESNKKKKPTM